MYLFDSKKESDQIRKYKTGKTVKYKSVSIIHHFKCDNCGSEFTRQKNGTLYPKTDHHYCTNCPSYFLAQKLSNSIKNKKFEKEGIKSKVLSNGYKEIFVGDEYPYRKQRWVREHIVVMERYIKQKIPTGMVVHHIDNNKTNNDIDNLLLCTVDEHNKCHSRIEKIVFELFNRGLVGFDRNKMEYYLK